MTVEHADQVVALARGHADDADRPGRALIERVADVACTIASRRRSRLSSRS